MLLVFSPSMIGLQHSMLPAEHQHPVAVLLLLLALLPPGPLLRESITAAVGDSQFLHAKADSMASNIAEGCLKRLAALNKPFKYVLTCNLTQKAGAGLHAATCTRWSDKTDGKLSVQWENTTMTVLVTVYYLAI
jgi:dynein light chain Tctex-type 1